MSKIHVSWQEFSNLVSNWLAASQSEALALLSDMDFT